MTSYYTTTRKTLFTQCNDDSVTDNVTGNDDDDGWRQDGAVHRVNVNVELVEVRLKDWSKQKHNLLNLWYESTATIL